MSPAMLDLAVPISVARQPARPRGPQLEVVDASYLYSAEFEETEFLIDGLLTKGLTLLAGRPKVGKSWLTMQLALHVAHGTPVFGQYAAHQGRVTYLALEEPQRRTAARLRRLVPEKTPFLENLHFIYRLKPMLGGGAAELDAHLTANPSELVVIDTLLAVSQGRPNRDVFRADYAEVTVVRELAEKHQTAFLLVAHSRKASAEYHVDSVAGTSGVTAAADAIWSLTRKPEGSILEISGREMEETALALALRTDHPFGWVKTGSGDLARTSEARADLIAALRDEGWLKPVDLARQTGKNPSTVRRLLQEMLQSGQVFRNQEGRYGLH